jgi:hypothetical protein
VESASQSAAGELESLAGASDIDDLNDPLPMADLLEKNLHAMKGINGEDLNLEINSLTAYKFANGIKTEVLPPPGENREKPTQFEDIEIDFKEEEIQPRFSDFRIEPRPVPITTNP